MLSEQKQNIDLLLNAIENTGLAVNSGNCKFMAVGRHDSK